jgi:hypothetical protein
VAKIEQICPLYRRIERGYSRIERGYRRIERDYRRIERGYRRIERGYRRIERGYRRIERPDPPEPWIWPLFGPLLDTFTPKEGAFNGHDPKRTLKNSLL